MLTQADRTVADCLAVLDEIAPLRLRHIGFKDIGADEKTLRQLAARIRETGARSYLEVVAISEEAALQSAKMAVALGVDCLLGGTQVPETLAILEGSGIAYFPFPGRPFGHPTQLGGTPAAIAAHCTDFVARGCAGVDLLAYRATEAEPLALVHAARHALGPDKQLICAGGVDHPERIAALLAAGCDAFTVGSAVFERRFAPENTGLRAQLERILACL